MNRIRKKIDGIVSKTLIFFMSVMVCNVLWQIFSRFAIGNPSAVTDEIARYAMIWVGLLGTAYMSSKNKHVAINILLSSVDTAKQRKINILISSLIAIFVLVAFVIGGVRLVYITAKLGQYSPAIGLPMSVVYSVLPISGILIFMYKLMDIKKWI